MKARPSGGRGAPCALVLSAWLCACSPGGDPGTDAASPAADLPGGDPAATDLPAPGDPGPGPGVPAPPDPSLLPGVPEAAGLVASVAPHPDMAVVARVQVRPAAVPGATHVAVLHGTGTGYGLATPWIPLDPAGDAVTLPVLEMEPAATNHLQVLAAAGTDVVARSGDLQVDMPPLPLGFPLPEITLDDGTATGWVLYPNLAVDPGATEMGWFIAADHDGRIAWYRTFRDRCDKGMDMRMTPDGHFLMYQYDLEAVEEVDRDGNTVRLWRDPTSEADLGTDGHDNQRLDDGGAALIGHDSFLYDLSKVRPSWPSVESRVIGSTLTVLNRDGTVRRHWSAKDAYTPEDTLFFLPPNWVKGSEFDHLNSFALGPGDDAYVSLICLGVVAKVDLASGQVAWQLGGKRQDLEVVGDPLGGIMGVHGLVRLDNGNLLAFDNGFTHDPQVSRAVEYRVDEAARTATMVWEYRDDTFVGTISGGVWRRRNGNTIISWGLSGRVDEVTPEGQVAWSMQVGPTSRANSTWSLYPELEPAP